MSFHILKNTKKRWLVCACLLHALSGQTARAQFVPGRFFISGGSQTHCKVYRDDYVFEMDPLNQIFGVFASLTPNSCAALRSIAMSPDGKRLRVAALNWGAILEFDPQGNWEIVIDGSDGVFPAANWNSITYDRHGNFYVSGRGNVRVMRFPANGGPAEVLAYYNNDGVIMEDAYSLSVGPSGEVYVAGAEKIYLIDPDGTISLFDSVPGLNEFIYSVLVDEAGYLHAQAGGYWYRYLLGDASSRVVFSTCTFKGGICSSESLVLSPDRTRIYTNSFDYSRGISNMISVDPYSGAIETVLEGGGSNYFAVVPLRGDVDGDDDSDLLDLEWLSACMEGPGVEASPSCDLADMDADGDVDLFDAQSFLRAHSRLQN